MMKEFNMHILDIVQNSVRAEATKVFVEIVEDVRSNTFSFKVTDNGRGMDEDLLEAVQNPFVTTRTTRKIGLGIPFLKQTCQQCGGDVTISSKPGEGTVIEAVMQYNSIDRPPLGDIAGTMFMTIMTNPEITVKYKHTVNGQVYELDMEEVYAELDGVPLSDPAVSEWLRSELNEGIQEIAIAT